MPLTLDERQEYEELKRKKFTGIPITFPDQMAAIAKEKEEGSNKTFSNLLTKNKTTLPQVAMQALLRRIFNDYREVPDMARPSLSHEEGFSASIKINTNPPGSYAARLSAGIYGA